MTKSEKHDCLKSIHENLKVIGTNLQHIDDSEFLQKLQEQTKNLKNLILKDLVER